jgi:predicted Fe-Mo cluster-binding NifX family protein
MKVAIPTREGYVDGHFGHCEHYTILTIVDKKIVAEEKLNSGEECGCKSGIAKVLKEKGVTVMLAGNMGAGAQSVLNFHDIEVIRGCQGTIKEVTNMYLEGSITDNGVSCSDHGECAH